MNTLEQTTTLEKKRAQTVNDRLNNSVNFLNEKYPKTLEANIVWHGLFKTPDVSQSEDKMAKEQETVMQILNIISDKLSIDIDEITPKTEFDNDLDANECDIADLISEMCDCFNVEISRNPEDYIYVDDLVEAVTGISYWNKDFSFTDDYDINNEENDVERFCSFYQSYINGEYASMNIDSLTQMFAREGNGCRSQAVASQFHCVAAVARLEHFLVEWFDNAFTNYKKNKELVDLVSGLENSLEEITICCNIMPDDNEFIIIRQTIRMVMDYWVNSNTDHDYYVGTYGRIMEHENSEADNYLFNKKWILSIFRITYNKILSLS